MTTSEFTGTLITTITVWILAIFGIVTFLDKGSWKSYIYGLITISVIILTIVFLLGCAETTENIYQGGACYRVHNKVNPIWQTWDYQEINCKEMGIERIR